MSNEELVAVIQAGAPERMGELWEQVAGLVEWKARQVMTALDLQGNPCGIELEDLTQSGYLALVKAIDTYKPTAGAFSTWLVYHLKNVFAEATGYRTQRERNEPLNTAVSLEKPLTDDSDSSLLGDFIPDPQAAATMLSAEERLWQEQLHEALEAALGAIPQNYGEVLRLRHYQNMTMEEVGESLGVSKERVRQMEDKGLRILRKPKNAACLYSFYDFDFYCHTGLTAFTHTGMSVQERYLMIEEERKEREERRRQELESKRQKEKIQSQVRDTIELINQEAQATVARMTPEEKRALLEKYGYA